MNNSSPLVKHLPAMLQSDSHNIVLGRISDHDLAGSFDHSERLASKINRSKNILNDIASQSKNQSPQHLIEGQDEETLKIEIVCLEVESENVSLLEPGAVCTTNCSESPSPCPSKTNLVQELKKWALKYNIQPAAFSDLLEILSSYYPELDLKTEFKDFEVLNKEISVEKNKESSGSKSKSSSSAASCASEVDLDPISEDNCSDQLSPSHRLSKRRRVSCSKTEEFSRFKDDLLQICRSELRQVCQDEFSKWNQECHEHTKIVRGVATDLKHVKEDLKSVKSMMPLLSKPSKR